MRLLLDTHIFLWYTTADPRLPASFLAAIRGPAAEIASLLDSPTRIWNIRFGPMPLSLSATTLCVTRPTMVDLDKPHLWKADVAASVDLFNSWFMLAAPKAFRDSRVRSTALVEAGVLATGNLGNITPAILRAEPSVLRILRSATCPPLARDRLSGLAGVTTTLVKAMEDDARLPPRGKAATIDAALTKLADVITTMLDIDLFPWLSRGERPTEEQRHQASIIVADRLCGALADPIIRNAQERRQLALIGECLTAKGYCEAEAPPIDRPVIDMAAGTFSFRMNLIVGRDVRIPIDCVIQPKVLRPTKLPILIEAKSAGDFTNTNKRRKEEATKVHQLRAAFGKDVEFVLFLCGYFDCGYLGYEAAEGIDWIWEHRISDLDLLEI